MAAPATNAPDLTNPFGTPAAPTDDPGWQRPKDPLNAPIDAGVVRREIPIVTIATYWTPPRVRLAFADLVAGQFDAPAQLVDSMIGDSRVASGLDSRVGGLLGRPIDFEVPKRHRDSSLARECLEAWEASWPRIGAEPMLGGMQTWAILLGHGHSQILWDTSGEYDVPIPQVWHARYTYYDWFLRRIMAVTQDGPVPITPGDGHWILHAPHGEYRGWMRGAMRAIAPWWLSRNYALRDASRWSEVHGLPMVKLKHPATADRNMVARFRTSMSNRGGETCVDLPQGVPEAGAGGGANANFDVEFLEAMASTFDGFFKLIAACDQEITLSLLAQTLTSSVGPEGRGSYAAARVHADVRQALLEADARALARTIYEQLARPFAFANFGNADLAPDIRWNIEPYEDGETRARTALTVTQVLVNLANAGHEHEDPAAFGRQFGVDLGRLRPVKKPDAAPAKPGGKGDASKAPSPSLPRMPEPEQEAARSRFVAVADRYARLRIDLGADTAELAAETEALEALLAAEVR